MVGEVAEQQDGLGLGERGDHRAHPDDEQPFPEAPGQRPETTECHSGGNRGRPVLAALEFFTVADHPTPFQIIFPNLLPELFP
ncbi:hypothetical protein ACQ4WX_22840 [Streptomyces lasalocidi]